MNKESRIEMAELELSKRVIFAVLIITLGACTSEIPNRNPTGELFPSISGLSLDDQNVQLPTALGGAPAVILVGYKQGAQFDIDRWVLGLMQTGLTAPILELPTIPGLLPSFASGWIDDGMRSGIPKEDWAAVVTLYGKSAKPIAAFTGTNNGRLARVLVLNAGGTVVWFNDAGYSASKALAIAELLRVSKP